MKFKVSSHFGKKSKEGFRHFQFLWLSIGCNGFAFCVFGIYVIIRLWESDKHGSVL